MIGRTRPATGPPDALRALTAGRITSPLLSMLLLALTEIAVVPTTLGAGPYMNIRVNVRMNNPEETAIAVNPRNPQNVVAVAQTPCHFYTSLNGGSVWSEGDLPDPRSLGDPSVTFDRLGNAYYCYIGRWDHSGIFISRSSDGGLTWPAAGTAIVEHEGSIPFEDKSWPVCDWTNGPHANNVYVAWTRFSVYGSSAPTDSSWILFSRSTDGGQSFSAPSRISDRGGNAVDSDGTVEGAVPAVGPDGTIYVAWAGPRGIEFDRSTNGGISFGRDSVISDQPGGWDFEVPGIYRANGLPVTKVDLSPGPHRGRVYVNWSDQRNGDTDVFLIHSDDQGTTWSAPLRVNDDGIGNGAEQFFTWIDVDPASGTIYIVFYDRRDHSPPSTATDVFLALSEDGGDTFVNEKISASSFVPDPSVFFGDYTGISAFAGRVRPIWTRMDGAATTIWTALIDRVGAGVAESRDGRGRPYLRPNPMRSGTWISLPPGSSGSLAVAIVDPEGRIVRRLASARRDHDRALLLWDGADDEGRPVAAGVYFVTGPGLAGARVSVIR